ncbi:Ger(x)C family spore germination C-terminal domain-containing protein [Paenibacillus donghaensis]|uniref:Ger(x)C family spore germination C-terminal domain-containing protein n=1 Tax=Paenibacillus donghaensis TaxID=414771 RepID=UPI0012FDA490|nr:Ger(x)C family spore germination C-terminal domain-containing protein [Paenibacillus donghaensis]
MRAQVLPTVCSHRRRVPPRIRYTIKIKGILEENSTQEVVTHKLLKKISAAGEADLSNKVKAMLTRIQASGMDPFGWGLHYGARHFNNAT